MDIKAEIKELRNSHPEWITNDPGTCQWTETGECWETSCGNAFVIMEGTPQENAMSFCPYCGRKIESELTPDQAGMGSETI